MPVQVDSSVTVPVVGLRRSRYRTWLLAGILTLVSMAAIVVVLLVTYWPFTEQALVDILQERTVRSVIVGRFEKTYFPPGFVAERISFLHRKHREKPPLITIEKLVVQGSYWGLMSPHKHLSIVRLYGMHVTVPPSKPDGEPNPVMPLTHGTPGPPLIINNVVADGTVLTFIQRTPGNPPFRLAIGKLLLNNVGNNLPMEYQAVIDNPNPPSRIESAGQFGTWKEDDPAATPLHGWYRMSNANLGVYPMLSGILRSSGSFTGVPGAVAVKGSVDVPNFHVKDSTHTRPLRADIEATVAATDGNVDLNSVIARFDHTTLILNGSIEGRPKEPGKAVSLQIRSAGARVDDILNLVLAARQAPLTGEMTLNAQVALPQGATSFLRDMAVNGSFRVTSGVFTDSQIQEDLTRVSNSAARRDKVSSLSPNSLRSELSAGVSVQNAVATLSGLRLAVPGAVWLLNGPYSLEDYSMDLHGSLQTSGSPSASTTGFKSLLLKGLTPFLKKRQGRTVIPFKISGRYHDVKVGFDLRHKQN